MYNYYLYIKYIDNMEFWKRMNNVIESLNPKDEVLDLNTCLHTIYNIEGYNTCIKCGCVFEQLFKKEDEDYGFVEEKKIFTTKYSQMKDIRKKFLEYTIKIMLNL